ncbi:MAG: hypothetical protein J7L76_00985 [Spirochaetaceae bacterium]|nr:hypothetical protein [Spirochaetaceae bacterium]RKX81566.1 MAG: hypothetical protein DRP60_00320 [Spirochaetota bacterium]RKX97063.1 MAG: hypothetical protein DRZ90_07455 [Spirochaetota bacterium]
MDVLSSRIFLGIIEKTTIAHRSGGVSACGIRQSDPPRLISAQIEVGIESREVYESVFDIGHTHIRIVIQDKNLNMGSIFLRVFVKSLPVM